MQKFINFFMASPHQSKFTHKKHVTVLLIVLTVFFYMINGCGFVTQGIVSGASKTFPGCIYFANTDEKLVALTIDDGPDSFTTRQILSVLEQYNAKATFFLIGSRVHGNQDVVSKIVEQGHEIGHHMFTGKTTIRMPYDEFTEQFNKTDSILSQYAEVRWFRPGSGWYNDEMIEYLSDSDCNYRCVLGSVYPFDVQIPSTTFAAVFILINTRPGSIIVLHDRGDRGKRTVKVLSKIIPKLQKRGYTFVTLSKLFEF
ncbi:MAG: polysaccharide deacetylase family protein [Calditrichaceae bacterium]|nr:polysaccharide deacetylase family protein [Calditrichaceae bacterium]